MFVYELSGCGFESRCSHLIFQLSGYKVLHQIRKNRKGGGVCVSAHENEDLSINCDAIQSLSIEISSTKSKNIILNTIYRPPNGDMKQCKTHLKDLFSKNGKNLKNIVLAGDSNINFLDFETNKNVQDFLNLMFRYNMTPLTNKPTRVTKHSASVIDHIITNNVVGHNDFKSAIIKTDLSDHFPIVFAIKTNETTQRPGVKSTYKRSYCEKNIDKFKNTLHNRNWDDIQKIEDPNKAYKYFLDTFTDIYDNSFPKSKVKVKFKSDQSLWITKGIAKSSKKKQRHYEKFLKNRTPKNEETYKTYKNLFETIKKRSKKNFYSEKLRKFKGDARKTWGVMKEILGKCNTKPSTLRTKITVNKTDIFDAAKIADEFNKFFTNIGTDLANKIPNASKPFDSYIPKANTSMESQPLSINEPKDAFFSLKITKSPGHDGVSFNVIKKCFGELCKPLKYLFNLSIVKGIFPDDLKIAKVTPIYKADNSSNVSNFRPISVLPCFSKMLERIMYSRLQKYLKDHNIQYDKQFGFQTGHSTDHAIAQLVDQSYETFEKNYYTLGVFIDLSKALDTVDHSILLRKLESYGITGRNYAWIKSYLSNRLQYIQVDENCRTEYCVVKCGVSILGPLLFLLYVNDLKNASSVLDPIMFGDDTNLFYTHSNMKKLFSTMN